MAPGDRPARRRLIRTRRTRSGAGEGLAVGLVAGLVAGLSDGSGTEPAASSTAEHQSEARSGRATPGVSAGRGSVGSLSSQVSQPSPKSPRHERVRLPSPVQDRLTDPAPYAAAPWIVSQPDPSAAVRESVRASPGVTGGVKTQARATRPPGARQAQPYSWATSSSPLSSRTAWPLSQVREVTAALVSPLSAPLSLPGTSPRARTTDSGATAAQKDCRATATTRVSTSVRGVPLGLGVGVGEAWGCGILAATEGDPEADHGEGQDQHDGDDREGAAQAAAPRRGAAGSGGAGHPAHPMVRSLHETPVTPATPPGPHVHCRRCRLTYARST